jgi:hypothetical protein
MLIPKRMNTLTISLLDKFKWPKSEIKDAWMVEYYSGNCSYGEIITQDVVVISWSRVTAYSAYCNEAASSWTNKFILLTETGLKPYWHSIYGHQAISFLQLGKLSLSCYSPTCSIWYWPWPCLDAKFSPKFHYAKRRFPVTSKCRHMYGVLNVDEIKN